MKKIIVYLSIILLLTQCSQTNPNKDKSQLITQINQDKPVENTPNKEEINKEKYNVFSKSGFGAFTIAYPKNWEVIENPNRYVCAVFIQPEYDYNFRNNFNIIVSNNSKSIDALYTTDTPRKMREVYPDYKLINKTYTSLKGFDCMEVLAKCTMDDFPVIQNQYMFKSNNNTAYTISFTVSADIFEQEKGVIQEIINSISFR